MSTFPVHTLSDGTKVPGVAFGIGTAHYGKDDDGLVDTIKTAISVGFRHLDGAEVYGVGHNLSPQEFRVIDLLRTLQNEISLGKAIAQSGVPRNELFGAHRRFLPYEM